MNVLGYGGGAVCLGISSCLLKSKHCTVDIIARKDTVKHLTAGGLKRTGIFGNYSADNTTFNCYTFLRDIQPQKAYDFILVCVKSPDSLSAAKDIYEHSFLLNKETKIVLCQNGWGNAEIFASFFPKEQIYNARIITGFTRNKPNEVTITVHADPICIGSLHGADLSDLKILAELITKGGIPCEITNDIEKDIWAKMLYNCPLNSLGAILDVPYGVLAKCTFGRSIMEGIIEEIFSVLKVTNYKTHWQSSNDFLKVFYKKLVPSTAEHKSSTLQDILAKKKTEIDALNGAIIKLANKHQINVPYNFVVYNMVKFIEANNSYTPKNKVERIRTQS